MKKAPEKVGLTVAQNEDFMSEFCNCVWSKHTKPGESDELWNSMLQKYDLMNNSWLQHMFEIRQDWIPSYYRNMPMSGVIRTTSRLESENNFFGHFTTPHYELLAACFDCGLHSMIGEEDVQIVTPIDQKRNSKMHRVRYHLDNNRAECNCKMYEREGIPCRHILWVFKEKGMKSLPAAYVKTRWTKAAMNMLVFDLGSNLIEDTTKTEAVKKKVGQLWSKIFTCMALNKACFQEEIFKPLLTKGSKWRHF
ncbi:Protein FAR1-RELATED SEQUENCE 5 [Bienertia sinuspersici]